MDNLLLKGYVSELRWLSGAQWRLLGGPLLTVQLSQLCHHPFHCCLCAKFNCNPPMNSFLGSQIQHCQVFYGSIPTEPADAAHQFGKAAGLVIPIRLSQWYHFRWPRTIIAPWKWCCWNASSSCFWRPQGRVEESHEEVKNSISVRKPQPLYLIMRVRTRH